MKRFEKPDVWVGTFDTKVTVDDIENAFDKLLHHKIVRSVEIKGCQYGNAHYAFVEFTSARVAVVVLERFQKVRLDEANAAFVRPSKSESVKAAMKDAPRAPPRVPPVISCKTVAAYASLRSQLMNSPENQRTLRLLLAKDLPFAQIMFANVQIAMQRFSAPELRRA